MISAVLLALLVAAPLTDAETEDFLLNAEIVSVEEIEGTSTSPKRVTLTRHGTTLRGLWKTFDGTSGFITDSWRREVAAYRLSKILGIDVVPPTIERTIDGSRGSLQLWVEGCSSLLDVRSEDVDPDQLRLVRLFRAITNDPDTNPRNVLVCGSKLYAVDSSRAFLDRAKLLHLVSVP